MPSYGNSLRFLLAETAKIASTSWRPHADVDQNMLRQTLADYADDSWLAIRSLTEKECVLEIEVASRGGERRLLRIPELANIDMSTGITLGSVRFGDFSLLPTGYLLNRNRGYDGDEHKYKVMKITDNDENEYYLIAYGEPVFEEDDDQEEPKNMDGMTKRIFDLAAECVPEFPAFWNGEKDLFTNDDGFFTSHGVMAVFSHLVSDRLRKGQLDGI